MVERFFRELTEKCLRRGAFKNVAELEQAIFEYIEIHNGDPSPFIWTAEANAILENG